MKKDTILWVRPEQLASEQFSKSIKKDLALPKLLNAPSAQPNVVQVQSNSIAQSNIANSNNVQQPQTQSTWSVWDEVQAWRGGTTQQCPRLIAGFEQNGFGVPALALSLLYSVFPIPRPTMNVMVPHTPVIPQPTITNLPKPNKPKQQTIVLKRTAIRTDLEMETKRGLGVLKDDPYWQEHLKRNSMPANSTALRR